MRQHDVALLRQMLGIGKFVDEPAGEHVDQLDCGVTDDETPRCSDRNRHLDRQHDLGARGRANGAHRAHGLLDRQAARCAASAVVAVEPARDRVTAEVDDLAAVAIDVVDDGVEDPVEVSGQFLGAALRAQLVGQALR